MVGYPMEFGSCESDFLSMHFTEETQYKDGPQEAKQPHVRMPEAITP